MASPEFSGLAKSTKAVYTSLSKQLRAFFGDMRMQQIKPMHIYQWLDGYHSPHQANIGRAMVSNVMEIAVRKGLIDHNPVKDTRPLTVKGRERYMTDEEFRTIREKANAVLRCAMDLSYLTGCRISDVLKMQISDCTEDGILVAAQKTAKRSKTKQLFAWNPALLEAVEAAKAIPRPVRGFALLCTRRGTQYSYATINDWWLEAVKAAGVAGVVFHDIRAKSATDAKLLRMDYQALLGHADKRMSQRYIRVAEVKEVAALPRRVK